MKSAAENLELWEQRISERIQSGVTINEWCLKNGISKNRYHYWNQKICENQKQNSNKEIIFADVTSNLSTEKSITKEVPASSDFRNQVIGSFQC